MTTAAVDASTDSPVAPSVKVGQDEIELGISESEYAVLTSTGATDVNWLTVIKPHIFVKKMVNTIPCEYYLKKLYSVGKIEGVTNCGYANNSYNQKMFSFTKEKKSYFDRLRTNLLAPVTDVYVAFIKNASSSLQMTTVQANFANFLTSTFEYGGIQTVTGKYAEGMDAEELDYNTPKEFLYHSLVEYSNETLVETEINHIEHTFLCNVNDIEANHIRFGYNPFHHIPIRVFSNNIQTYDVYFGMPDYATYSEKYQTYRWRTILEIGNFEAQGNGIDFPFLNNAFYVFSDILLNIKNYSSPKVSSLLTGGYLLSSYVDTLTQTDPTNTIGVDGLDDSLLYNNLYDKPFESPDANKLCG
jgi:hypothetical protein